MANAVVLVVEDDAMNMKLVRTLLQLEHFNILEASDAEQGLHRIRQQRPDLILMDIQLPGMDGLDAIRVLKADPDTRKIPILALTSYAMEGDEQKARAAGCDGYLTKPINTRTFLDTIHNFLGSRTPDPEPALRVRSGCQLCRILIVDDEPMNLKLLSAKLPDTEFEKITARDGHEALAKIETLPPDLILLDVMMPGLDGYEVTRRLKNNPDTQHIPVILVTALDGSSDKERGMQAGADEFLSKPVNTAELRARIYSMLRLKQYQEQLSQRTRSERDMVATPATTNEVLLSSSHRVLLVEDSPPDVRLIQAYTRGMPYTLSVAHSAEEGLARLKAEKFDLVLLDILLPGMTGFDFCHHIKALDATRDVQVLMVTCLDDLESKIRGVEQGTDDFLAKPIDRRELQVRIKALLKKKAYLDQLRSHYELAMSSAVNDGLTGLYNHTYFKRFLSLEVKRSLRQEYSTALIMFDLDDFKSLNDTFGHPVGDRVLKELADLVKKNVREIDLAARYGGEEFALVLPYTDRSSAMTIAQRIRQSIADRRFVKTAPLSPGDVTASFGLAMCPEDARNCEALVQVADHWLYRAKREGKNRICTQSGTSDLASVA